MDKFVTTEWPLKPLQKRRNIAVKQFTEPKFSTLEIALAFSPLRDFDRSLFTFLTSFDRPLKKGTNHGHLFSLRRRKKCKTKDEIPGLQTLYPLARRSCGPVWPCWNQSPKLLWEKITPNSKVFHQAAVSVRSEIARRASKLQRCLEYVCHHVLWIMEICFKVMFFHFVGWKSQGLVPTCISVHQFLQSFKAREEIWKKIENMWNSQVLTAAGVANSTRPWMAVVSWPPKQSPKGQVSGCFKTLSSFVHVKKGVEGNRGDLGVEGLTFEWDLDWCLSVWPIYHIYIYYT